MFIPLKEVEIYLRKFLLEENCLIKFSQSFLKFQLFTINYCLYYQHSRKDLIIKSQEFCLLL